MNSCGLNWLTRVFLLMNLLEAKVLTMYRDFLLPIHQQLIPQVTFPDGSPAPVILHCCGKSLDRIQYFREAGFAVYHFESANAAEAMVEGAGGMVKLAGNVNNPITLFSGTPEDAWREAQRAIDAGVDIIAPECAVPLQTPIANLKAIWETCQANPRLN
jgi:[methyl-Co(III) methanol-specific corrinoid protein]:coenzyme M methyltransferase